MRSISKAQVMPYYKECAEAFEKAYDYIKSCYDTDYVKELSELRGYIGEEQKQMIEDLEIGACEIPRENLVYLGENARDLGLITEKGEFLLNGRYIVPIRDIANNLVALVGYIPDYQPKKYMTTPSPFFSKSCMLFNFRQAYDLSWQMYNGLVIVVEGIFDALSLSSIGLPAVAVMGSALEPAKGELLKFFKRPICIPDDDNTGKKALNRYAKYGWKAPNNALMVNLHGSEIFEGVKLKDMDNFVSWYEPKDVINTLLEISKSRNEIEDLFL